MTSAQAIEEEREWWSFVNMRKTMSDTQIFEIWKLDYICNCAFEAQFVPLGKPLF